MFVRKPDWLDRLNAVLEEAVTRPHDWQANDCCRVAARAIVAMTGDDPMPGFDYATEDEAWAQIGAYGGLRRYLDKTFGGWKRPAFARRGDLMLARGGKAVGICVGAKVAIMSEAGFGYLPLRDFVACYPLGWPEASDG